MLELLTVYALGVIIIGLASIICSVGKPNQIGVVGFLIGSGGAICIISVLKALL